MTCKNCEKLQNYLDGARMYARSLERQLESKEVPLSAMQRATAHIRRELDKEKAKRRRAVEKLRKLRQSRNKLLPEELQQAQRTLKQQQTKLRDARALFESERVNTRHFDKSDIRKIRRALHSDRLPEHLRVKADEALAVFNRAIGK